MNKTWKIFFIGLLSTLWMILFLFTLKLLAMQSILIAILGILIYGGMGAIIFGGITVFCLTELRNKEEIKK